MTKRVLVLDDRLARDEPQKRTIREAFASLEVGSIGLLFSVQFDSGQRQVGNTLFNDVEAALTAVGDDPSVWTLVLLDMQFDEGALDAGGEAPTPNPRFGLEIERALLGRHPDLKIVRFTTSHEKELDGEKTRPFLSKTDVFASVAQGADTLRLALVEHGNLSIALKAVLLRVPGDTFIGSVAMLKLYASAYRYAKLASNILIRGASGSGKENLARYIHSVSPNCKGPFVARNLGAISAELFESEMFGVEPGTVPGVKTANDGDFFRAGRGTLLLDEFGTASPDHQAALLRVVGERNFRRVHGKETLQVQCNVIAATQDNVEARADAGNFRQDLNNRFPLVLVVPPLSERREEIPDLAHALLTREMAKQGKQGMEFASQVLQRLSAHALTKNVRSIEEGLIRAISKKSSHSVIQWDDLGLDDKVPDTEWRARANEVPQRALQPNGAESQLAATPPSAVDAALSRQPDRQDSLATRLLELGRTAIAPDTPELFGLLRRLDEATAQLRRELAYAALRRCRHQVTGKIVVQTAMQILSGDNTMTSTNAARLLNALLGHKQNRKLELKELQDELDKRDMT